MMYYLYFAEYISRSPYSYWIVMADEPLIKFEVWSKRKSFNSLYYNEIQVLELINEKYPNSVRRVRPKRP